MSDTDLTIRWYVIRCQYGNELYLGEKISKTFNVETYVPFEKVRHQDAHGRFRWIQRSVLTGYVFLHTDKHKLAFIVREVPKVRTMVCFNDQKILVPVVVNDKSMADFIRVSGSREQKALYLDPAQFRFNPGDRVRVIAGPLEGLEGYFVQVGAKHEKRVIVRLDNFIAVATEAIPAAFVKRLKS